MPVSKSFPADPAILREIRGFVRQQAEEYSFFGETSDLVLAVTEACTNSILHSDTPDVTVSLAAFEDRLEVEVADQGVFRPMVPVPELDGEGHRGIHLMMAMTDEFAIREGTESTPGTVVRLTKRKT